MIAALLFVAALSADPAVDLQIALLEAAFRLPVRPGAPFFLGLVGTDRARAVRWTAARLGAELDREAARELRDPDPLVERRLVTPEPGGDKTGGAPAQADKVSPPAP